MTKIKLLVVDDEPAIRKLLERGLSSYDYDITAVSDGTTALTLAARHPAHVILLDVNLQSQPNGLDVCRQLHECSKTPIIMLTVRDEKPIRLAALNAGADDYVTKPFDMDELEARIRAVLRRTSRHESEASSGEIRVHDLVIDLVGRRVRLGGELSTLRPKNINSSASSPRVQATSLLLKHCWIPFGAILAAPGPNTMCVYTSTPSAKN